MSHTPGPWVVRDRWYIHVDHEGETYCHAEVKCGPTIPHDSPEHEANARLIAAAPDLLTAVTELLEVRDWWTTEKIRAVRKKAEAAIAKATRKGDAS